MIIHPYKYGSRSAHHLKEGLRSAGVHCIVGLNPPRNRASVLNWGGDDDFLDHLPRVLNRPSDISHLRNKLAFFRKAGRDERVVPWTTRKEVAQEWPNVFVRSSVTGMGGFGVTVLQTEATELPDAPLYTRRIFGTHEFRIHVGRKGNDKEFHVFDVQRKVFQKSPEALEPKSWAVRNHANGFVFVRNSRPPDSLLTCCTSFMRDIHPDVNFCALDVIYSEETDRSYILEGNTAPGLEGETVNSYVRFILDDIKNR